VVRTTPIVIPAAIGTKGVTVSCVGVQILTVAWLPLIETVGVGLQVKPVPLMTTCPVALTETLVIVAIVDQDD
jgi:hypothetical protein